ncbi:ABC transporter substrate-binding protein [Aquipuribacter sp. SD81]|uniref:ABC transporter substrate-binding protein n=1 Tax=Aquipuribacter sp. SD81 TaxID=3127703 RepID=UPI0030175FD1
MRPLRTHRHPVLIPAAVLAGLLPLAACSAPGGSTTDAAAPDDASAPAAEGSADPSGAAVASDVDCGDDPITMEAYFETGFPVATALTDAFMEEYPNVTWEVREDQFAVLTQNAPRVLADDPPDLMRLPQVSELAADGLLLNMDPYAEAFGWDEWPESQLEQMRVDDEGRRGDGPLYAMGINSSMTGIFYNRELAEQVGMTEPPATLAELDEVMQAAVDAGITPLVQFNGGATGGLAFPLQNLMAAYGDPGAINSWIYQQPDATIDTPENLEAVEHLQGWIDAGYFADDVNSLDYSMMMARFIEGDSLFIFNGDWESGNLDEQMPGNVGFFLMPPLEEGGPQAAMSAPLTFGVSANAANPDCAAFFLDWTATSETARDILVEVGGSRPMGPADAYMPPVDEGSVTAETLEAGATIAEDDGAMDFIANATGSIYAQSWTPQLQQLVAGQVEPADLLATVQADYESQVAGR